MYMQTCIFNTKDADTGAESRSAATFLLSGSATMHDADPALLSQFWEGNGTAKDTSSTLHFATSAMAQPAVII
jgi:hypothetical protein